MFFKIGVRSATLLKRDHDTGVFLGYLQNFKEHLFLQNNSALVAASGNKHCELMKTYTESLCCREKKMIYLNGSSKISVSR